jgi:hypothetical protein
MKRSPFLARAAASALVAAALFASCHEHGGVGDANEYVVACKTDMPAGIPFASDENYRKFVEADAATRIEVRDERALVVDPLPAMLSAATPPMFTFRPAMMAERPGPIRRWLGRLAAGVGLMPRALAHCPAFTGENYFLRLTNAADPKDHAYTAVLSVMSYTPDAAIWSKAMSGRSGQELKVTLWRATFLTGSISEGPFVASRAVSVKVGP